MADALGASWRSKERVESGTCYGDGRIELGDRAVTIDEDAVWAPSTPTKIVCVGLSAHLLIASS
jgi:hypothetical protein